MTQITSAFHKAVRQLVRRYQPVVDRLKGDEVVTGDGEWASLAALMVRSLSYKTRFTATQKKNIINEALYHLNGETTQGIPSVVDAAVSTSLTIDAFLPHGSWLRLVCCHGTTPTSE